MYTKGTILSLISHIHAETQEYTNRLLQTDINLVSSHGYILYLLSSNGEMTMGEITKRINRNKSTTTALVKKLIEENLVEEKLNKNDFRQKIIALTEKGKLYKEKTNEISEKLLAVCYENYSEQEKEQLLNLLLKMNKNIEQTLETQKRS